MNSIIPITISEIPLRQGATYVHCLQENHNGFVYVLVKKEKEQPASNNRELLLFPMEL